MEMNKALKKIHEMKDNKITSAAGFKNA